MSDRQPRARHLSSSALAESTSLDDYRWLVSSAGESWLAIARESLAEHSLSPSSPPPPGAASQLLVRLRKDLSAERARLVVQQIELRQRAREKFRLAERMFFTRKGLEQATEEQIANYKAARFPLGAVIFDLCCGIGGDLAALALRGQTLGLDLDPVAALLAQANVRAHGLAADRCTVEQRDVSEFDVAGPAIWHCDPDRRPGGVRTAQVEYGEPSSATIERLLRQNPNAALKLAPAAKAPASWLDCAELEWIGSRGECRQQVAWFSELARHPGHRAATIVHAHDVPRTVRGDAREAVPVASQPGRYLYEPDPAVLAANLTGVICREYGLASISAGVAYLTGDKLVSDAALEAFEVRDVLPLDRKQLRAYCRQRGIGRLEIKKRGVDVDPEGLRKEVVGSGDVEATLLVAPVGNNVRVFVAARLNARDLPDTSH